MEKELKLTTVQLSEIDFSESRFKISPEIRADSMLESIRKSGLLNPPVLIKRDGKLIILSGWKRIKAARILDIERITVFILREKHDQIAFELPVYENLSLREFISIEKAEIIAKFKKFGADDRTICEKYLTLLNLPPKAQIIEDCIKIHNFKLQLRQAAFREDFSFPVLQKSAQFKPEERNHLFPVLNGMSRSSQMEVLENIMDIQGRDKCRLRQIFDKMKIPAILESDTLSAPQKKEKIRRLIHKERYPVLSSRQDHFKDAMKALGLPENFTILTTKNFEEEGFRLQMQCRTPEEFKNNIEEMKRMVQERGITILFDVLNHD